MEGNTFVINDLGLAFQDGSLDMTLHVDANWASDHIDWKSISGYCVFIGNMVALWGSKKQNSVALSTTKAEYMALAYGIKENIGSFRTGNMSHFKNCPSKKGTKYIVSQKGVSHV